MRRKIEELSFKTRLNIHYLCCFAGALLMMAGSQYSAPGYWHPILPFGVFVLGFGLIWRIAFVKCPHCGDGLYQSHADLKSCPNCGKELS